jgi:hypothetical protein
MVGLCREGDGNGKKLQSRILLANGADGLGDIVGV